MSPFQVFPPTTPFFGYLLLPVLNWQVHYQSAVDRGALCVRVRFYNLFPQLVIFHYAGFQNFRLLFQSMAILIITAFHLDIQSSGKR
jgi:hypothetical protein